MAILRQAYGEALLRHAGNNPLAAVLDADLAKSTMSALFRDAYPKRFYQVGVAEANMATMAAGMAAAGLKPFVHTFATFISSLCYLAAKSLIGYSGYPVCFAGANSGLTGAYDGSTHHAFDDLAVMSMIPGMTVFAPSDRVIVDWMVREAAFEFHGPSYLSIPRVDLPDLYSEGETFAVGRAKILRDGVDAAVIACGPCVSRARTAAEHLEKRGISVRVIDMFCLKPLDEEAIVQAARDTGAVVTVEEHSILNGLGVRVATVIARNGLAASFRQVGLNDCYTESGSYRELVQKYRVDVPDIERAVLEAMEKK